METKTCTLSAVLKDNHYEYLLGVSSDCLLILDDKKHLVEWIIEGDNNDGVIASADSEDEFLDAILVIKEMISLHINPILWLENKL